jgi:hypothetical protein
MEGGIGSVNFKALGSLYLSEADSFAITLTTADTYYPLVNGGSVNKGHSLNMLVSAASAAFTILVPGTYKFSGVASIQPDSATVIRFEMFKNSAAITIKPVRSILSFLNSQAINAFSGVGFIDCDAGDVLALYMASSAATCDLSILSMVLSLEYHSPLRS